MWTRRKFLITSVLIPPFFSKFVSNLWAQTKRILPKGFNRDELKNMNPAEIDARNLEIDPLDKFGTMGPIDFAVDIKTYRLKITGAVESPLSLSYDQILKYPSLTEVVLLICPGFFANNGRWTGVSLKVLLQEAQVKKEAKFLDVKGANEKVVRISLREIDLKKIFLAYRVNGDPLPKKHGFPLRLVYEDVNGSDWVKYVDEVVVL
jgi:sulfoxide reductase catalytic subunit YedY